MEVELTVEESSALQQALRSYCSELGMEISETDNPQFRRGLRDERTKLESVMHKLDAAAADPQELDENGRVVIKVVAVWEP